MNETGRGSAFTVSSTLSGVLALPKAAVAPSARWAGATVPRWMIAGGTMPLVFLAVVIAIQLGVGAFHSERGLYSDEASHFMNGLVVRDYLRDGLGDNPLTFAREYYGHYPKIAPLMWPPLFHVVLGAALLPGWSPTIAALVLVGVFTAWTAWRLYTVILRFSSVPVALGAVGLFLATPCVISLTSSVMLDVVIATFAIEAAYWLGRFVYSGRTRDAAIFGLMTALCCMTKGNGLSAVVAALLLPVAGHIRLLRRPGFYVAAAIVVVLASPPLFVAYRLDASLGDFGPLSWALMWERLTFFSRQTVIQVGIGPIVLALIGGMFATTRRIHQSSPTSGAGTGLAAMVAGAFLFHVLSPHRTSDPRYITLAFAPLLGLTALGVTAVTLLIQSRPRRWAAQISIFAVLWILHAVTSPVVAAQLPLGYRGIMTRLHHSHALAGRRLLVVSNESGEGAAVVEAAVLHATPPPTIVRGSKLLASDDWMGANFVLRYQDPHAILADLEAMHIEYILLDRSPSARTAKYWPQINAIPALYGDRLQLVSDLAENDISGPIRHLSLYRLNFTSDGPAKAIPLSTVFGNFDSTK